MLSNARYRSWALALLVLAGCGKSPQGSVESMASAQALRDGAMPVATVRAHVRGSFASLPDRGELLAYPRQQVRHDGAYTLHRTGLSEAYALRAIADGHLRVTTPSGQLLDFKYDRHIEHPSGDWTWVGHLPGHEEQQSIITFGEHAAFGSIAQPGKLPLRLTVRDGVSWLVETDRREGRRHHQRRHPAAAPGLHGSAECASWRDGRRANAGGGAGNGGGRHRERHHGGRGDRLHPRLRRRQWRHFGRGHAAQLPGRRRQYRVSQQRHLRERPPGGGDSGHLHRHHHQLGHAGKTHRLQLDHQYADDARPGVQCLARGARDLRRGPGVGGAQLPRSRERRLRNRLADRWRAERHLQQ